MRVGLITFHCALNYGAVLQTIALYNTLKALNPDTELIDFHFPPICSIVDKTRKKELTNFHNFSRFIVKGKMICKKKKNFDLFLKNNILLFTRECNTFEELKLLDDDYKFDLYVCGSDQIWNPYITHFEKAYLLKFASNYSRKISYAASIGQDSIDEDGLKFLKNNLDYIDSYSVREQSAVEILRSVGITNEINVHLDPVFFLSKEEWHNKQIPVKLYPKLSKYIFVYRLTDNPIMDKVLQELIQKTGLKCIAISEKLGKIPFISKKYSSVGPGEFLFLIENAEYIVTDSFHGIAFSLLFEKKLIAVSNLKRNTRIINLLNKVDMNECLVEQNKNRDFVPNVNYSFKYTKCKEILKNEIKKDFDYLKKEIELSKKINK